VSKLIKEIMDALNAVNQNKTEPYDRRGEVKRIEGKIAWVKLEGSDRETPVQMTIACEVGDTVQARIGGGSAWLTGNLTAPPTDDKKANQAISMVTNIAETVQETVDEALEDVSSVDDVSVQYCLSDSSSTFVQYGDWSNTPPTYVSGKYYWTRSVIEDDEGNVTYGEPRYSQDTQLSVETDIAFKSNNNHFWYDSSGAYVTTQDKSYATGSAVRITASGILQQVNGNTVSSWTNSGISFLQGGDTVASFGSGGANFYDSSGSVFSIGSTGVTYQITSNGQVRTVLNIYDDGYKAHIAGKQYTPLIVDYGVKTDTVMSDTYYVGSYKLLTIGTISGTHTVAGSSYENKSAPISPPTGYTPIGVIGWYFEGTASTYCIMTKCHINGNAVAYRMRNTSSTDATLNYTFYILYVATTQGY